MTTFFEGLSPRVRGNLLLGLGVEGGRGPIPACAGQPIDRATARFEAGAYPRVCGATGYGWHAFPAEDGLSPRVRGNR